MKPIVLGAVGSLIVGVVVAQAEVGQELVEFDDLSVKLMANWPQVEDAKLPPGVVVRWDPESAYREETPTRERLCLNGLWNFHPAGAAFEALPPAGSGWGWLKVPGS